MAWTKIAKPVLPPYTNLNPQGKEQYDQPSLTYDDANTFYDGINQSLYTKVSKPGTTFSIVQSNSSYPGSQLMTISFSSPVTKGNLIIVCYSSYFDNTVPNDPIIISDDKNNTWLTATEQWVGTSPINVAMGIFYAVANGNNSPVISLHSPISSGSDGGATIYECSGLDSSVNATNSTTTASTSTPTATALTTTAPSFIVAMAAQEAATGTFSACGGGFTLRNSHGGHIDAVADYQNAPVGSYSAIFNFNHSQKWLLTQTAFGIGPLYTKVAKPT